MKKLSKRKRIVIAHDLGFKLESILKLAGVTICILAGFFYGNIQLVRFGCGRKGGGGFGARVNFGMIRERGIFM